MILNYFEIQKLESDIFCVSIINNNGYKLGFEPRYYKKHF